MISEKDFLSSVIALANGRRMSNDNEQTEIERMKQILKQITTKYEKIQSDQYELFEEEKREMKAHFDAEKLNVYRRMWELEHELQQVRASLKRNDAYAKYLGTLLGSFE